MSNQSDFEVVVIRALRSIARVTASVIENKAKLIAPAFDMDIIHIGNAVKRLSVKFLPVMRKIQ